MLKNSENNGTEEIGLVTPTPDQNMDKTSSMPPTRFVTASPTSLWFTILERAESVATGRPETGVEGLIFSSEG